MSDLGSAGVTPATLYSTAGNAPNGAGEGPTALGPGSLGDSGGRVARSPSAFLEVVAVHHRYRTTLDCPPALDRIDLRVKDGQFVALMGPSGSGKSTLLTILGAMNVPTRGSVLFDGIDVYSLSDERRADFRHEYLGFVFQQHHLMPYLNSIENVLLPLVVSPLPASERRAKAEHALEMVGLADKMRRLPSELSGGEQARVAIARAVVNEPPLILADEPTGNLDSVTGATVIEMLAALTTTGHTIVMVTHDHEIAARAERIIRLHDGRIVEDFANGGAH